ncbi:hypothetical protein N7486_001109 [Penicillium sp. IBT 16267x]|nr:hypothetical protein N7486_001109 [Penicillium sp. IBT 16267x]
MECPFEWRVTENDGSSGPPEGGSSEELSLRVDIDDAAPSDTPKNNPGCAAFGNSALEKYTPDGNTLDIPTPESNRPENNALQNSTAEVDIPEAKDSNNSAPDNTSSEYNTLDDKTSNIAAPDLGDSESNSPEDIAPQNSIPGIDIPETGDSKSSAPGNHTPEGNSADSSPSKNESITIEVVAQGPDWSPTMATFEAPYDSPSPSPTSTAITKPNSSSAASTFSTNSIPAPLTPPLDDLPTPSNSPPSSSNSDSEDPQDETPDTTTKPVENPSEEGLLETAPASTEQDLIASLHLIADSIAQQRQVAAKSILHSGFYWSILVIIFEYLYRILWHTPADWIMILLLWICCVIATLSGIKMWTGGYLDEAERVGRWSWLFGSRWVSNFDADLHHDNDIFAPPRWTLCQGVWFRVPGGCVEKAVDWCALMRDRKKKELLRQRSLGGVSSVGKAWEEYSAGSSTSTSAGSGSEIDVRKESLEEGWMQDKVFVSRFNGRVIATLVIRVMTVDTDSVVTVSRDEYDSDVDLDGNYHPVHLEPVLRPAKVVIRAWTVLQKYRGSGVGLGILQFAIEYARELGLQGPEFAADHANSLRALPKLFNGGMDRDDKRARDRLAKETRKCVVAEQENGKND